MGDRIGIEWTDATWNPVTGCTKVSPGCDRCYAETIAHRFSGTAAYPAGFKVTLRPDRLEQPLRWSKPRRIFVNSMSDLFHADIPDDYVAVVWAIMSVTPRHTFQVLTKRPGRMLSLTSSAMFRLRVNAHRLGLGVSVLPDSKLDDGTYAWPLKNVWLGVSAEDQKWADVRIPLLLDTPAAVRFVSAEPLLAPINLERYIGEPSGLPGDWEALLDWVIAGGESGRGSRPMALRWARQLRDECAEASTAFLFEQWGEWYPTHKAVPDGRMVDGTWMQRLGKQAAGRELDGVTHDGYPQAVK